MNTLISIIIPCYNHGEYLKEAISSVETIQDKSLYEVIIVNDGSTDNFTIEILAEYSKAYTVINQKNMGLAMSRNIGIGIAKSDFILPLDSDNTISSSYVTDSIKILANPEIDVVYSDFIYFGDRKGINEVSDFNIEKLLLNNYIDACAVYRKEAWLKTVGYNPNMKYGWEDWDFWLSLFETGSKFYHLNKPCFNYRVRSNSMVQELKDDIDKISKMYQQIYVNHIDLYSRFFGYPHEVIRKLITKNEEINELKYKFNQTLLLNKQILNSRSYVFTKKYLSPLLHWFSNIK